MSSAKVPTYPVSPISRFDFPQFVDAEGRPAPPIHAVRLVRWPGPTFLALYPDWSPPSGVAVDGRPA